MLRGSERDLIRLRTNYRSGETVYLFRTTTSPQWARDLFLQYLRQANRLRDDPKWFNAITNNCTTNIFANMATTGQMAAGGSRYSWWVLLNGRAPEMLYRGGYFAGQLPFSELKAQAYVNPVANTVNDAPDFSQRIRKGRATGGKNVDHEGAGGWSRGLHIRPRSKQRHRQGD